MLKARYVETRAQVVAGIVDYNLALASLHLLPDDVEESLLNTLSRGQQWVALFLYDRWMVAPAKYCGIPHVSPQVYHRYRRNRNGGGAASAIRKIGLVNVDDAHEAWDAMLEMTDLRGFKHRDDTKVGVLQSASRDSDEDGFVDSIFEVVRQRRLSGAALDDLRERLWEAFLS